MLPLVTRSGDCGLSLTQVFAAPPATVFRAWSEAALFRRWWVPDMAGITLRDCQIDMRTGGSYRLEFAAGDASMAFHGRYLEVVPGQRIVWTNAEAAAGAITTVTLAAHGDQTLLTFHERYPDAAGVAEALAGSAAALPAQMQQLAELLAELA